MFEPEEFVSGYVKNMREDGVWGGNLELAAIMKLYNTCVGLISLTLSLSHSLTPKLSPASLTFISPPSPLSLSLSLSSPLLYLL